jgi:hypothetical protein
MSPPNGHAKDPDAAEVADFSPETHAVPVPPEFSGNQWFSQQEIKDVCAALEIPFDPGVIDWRVTNTTKNGKLRGHVIPYADQRAYTDRLNALFTPAGWTRKYAIHTTASFERSRDQKIVAKVLVTCDLMIFGLGSHSATGEEWADNDNAGTSAEAQAFKRACSCFGLGRYLYYYDGVWVDLDERKRPKSIPVLPGWATPAGWTQGLRPRDTNKTNGGANGAKASEPYPQQSSVIGEIEGMAEQLGRGLYRGLLRDLARVWSPRKIQDISLQQRVLEHMRSAERGLRRLEAALDKLGPEALVPVLKEHKLTSIKRVDNLKLLKQIVLELEGTKDTGL